MPRKPLKVLITCDTEIWPLPDSPRPLRLNHELQTDIYGATREGSFGVLYQVEVLNRHNLRGVFFVESLFSYAVGRDLLDEIVGIVQQGNQEIQLHLHSEWLEHIEDSPVPGAFGQNIRDFSLDDQTILLGRALEALKAAGVGQICAYRAGNFGANRETLTALRANGIVFDSSYNPDFLDDSLRFPKTLEQPVLIDGVWEFPVSSFQDYPGHLRPAQVCACSTGEMEFALEQAWGNGWHSFVIVSHSFELIDRPARFGQAARPVYTNIRRFEWLCEYLDRNRDRFETCGFADLDPAEFPASDNFQPPRSHMGRTAGRMVEQFRKSPRFAKLVAL